MMVMNLGIGGMFLYGEFSCEDIFIWVILWDGES